MRLTSILGKLRGTGLGKRPWLPLTIGLVLVAGGVVWLRGSSASSPRGYVPLTSGKVYTAAEFRAAQRDWKSAGLSDAKFSQGVISVPEASAERYRAVWRGTAAEPARPHWADAWQSATDRLGQFTGSRERAEARDISRAQVVSRLLEELPDIAAADVVWDESPSHGWRAPPRARATVYLRAAEGRSITTEVVDAVRRAVCGSKANLAPADVAVMDQTRMVTYDGESLTVESSRAVQLAAAYRSRIEAAFPHIAGLQVSVLALEDSSGASGAIPVRVAVTVPESSIRALAGLTDVDGRASLDPRQTSARRDVFQAVEQHLHRSMAHKIPLLLPAGLTLAAAQHLHVETLPDPAPPATVTARPESLAVILPANVDLAGWILPGIACVCGLGALGMLGRSWAATAMPRETASQLDATTPGTPADDPLRLDSHLPPTRSMAGRAATVQVPSAPIPPARANLEPAEHSLADPAPADPETRPFPQISRPPQEAGSLATSPDPALREAAALPADEPSAAVVPETTRLVAERRHAPRREVLQEVLSRLEGTREASRTDPGPSAHAAASSGSQTTRDVQPLDEELASPQRVADAPRPAASRPDRSELSYAAIAERSARRLDRAELAETIESLAGEPDWLLRELTAAIDVETWAQALFGTSRALQAQLASHFDRDAADQLLRLLRAARPVRLREIDAAQTEVLAVWERLRQDLPQPVLEPVHSAVAPAAA